jgi:tetratricopeptide (TPR) repeat protein
VGAAASPQRAEPPLADLDESAPDPDQPELKQRMAQALVTRARQDAAQGNYDAAIRKLERAARLDPQNADVQEALRRARRARKTELEVLRRRR